MERLRATHRLTGIVIMIVLVYLSVTGLMMQTIDLGQILFLHQTPQDPDLAPGVARQGGEFDIRTPADKSAQALPAAMDANGALENLLKAAQTILGNAPLRYVEFRMMDGRLVGNVQTPEMNASFDGASWALLNQSSVPPFPAVTSVDRLRYRIKEFHRMTVYGNWTLWINTFVGVALVIMIITGVTLYSRMQAQRRKQGLSGIMWVGGFRMKDDWKRAMHRGIGITAAIFLLVVACSGEWLAYESLVFGYRMERAQQQRRANASQNRSPNNGNGQNGPTQNAARANGPSANKSQLLNDADLRAMLATTLKSEQQDASGSPIKVIRIRAFGNAPQGIVITGNGWFTNQLVYNARTGAPEIDHPSPPGQGFPFGWDAHQTAKAIHRGSYFGLYARFLDLFAGLALLYLSVNGLSLYLDFRTAQKMDRTSEIVPG